MPVNARKKFRFHGLKKPKVRADMKKENLYNLSRMREPATSNRTYFQQKWTAKSLTRAYHGEFVRERHWIHMHTTRAPAVVNMRPDYLARSDGSELAAGRGSGLETGAEGAPRERAIRPTPYMQMTYHPMERRLDFAVFRALFASSARQARQMVVHGQVLVNGKVMRQPGYMLNPGDLFQVEPERVMWALGKMKGAGTIAEALKQANAAESAAQEAAAAATPAAAAAAAAEGEVVDEAAEEEEEVDTEIAADDPQAVTKTTLKTLRQTVKTTLDAQKKTLSGAQLRELRELSRELKSSLSKAASITPSQLEDLETKTVDLTSRAPSKSSSPEPQQPSPLDDTAGLQAALDEARDNPLDASRPYATPWQPRDYLAPFAFVPRYLEVNHAICSAVYLRHPVCYPGHAEVPTPFSSETGTLAFNWYLRRR